jgi:hypothetical protein
MLARIETGNIAFAASPALRAASIHLVSVLVLGAVAAWAPAALPLPALPWVEGALAALLGIAFGLPRWWLPINAFFFPAAAALLTLEVAPEAYLAGLGGLLLFNVAALRHRVPLFLSSRRAAAVVTTLLPRGAGFRMLDLGCGTGSLLANVAQVRPDGRYTGVEIAPVPYLLGSLRAWGRRGMRILWGDFWQRDLSGYDVVYAYLSPAPMARLWQKARAEMRPGTLFISNEFCVPGVVPSQIIPVGDRMRSTIYVWTM